MGTRTGCFFFRFALGNIERDSGLALLVSLASSLSNVQQEVYLELIILLRTKTTRYRASLHRQVSARRPKVLPGILKHVLTTGKVPREKVS